MSKRTNLEKNLRHKRRRSGVLVPLLEDLFDRPVEIESDEDVEWVTGLLNRMVARGKARGSAPLFSPSQLASCLRYVFLLKHHRELEIPLAPRTRRVEPHFYFFNGNFLHLKWQFALYKLELRIDDPSVFKLHGVEVPILSKHKDHGGTVDALCSIDGEPYIVDFKGLNVRTFSEITRGFIPPQYAAQLADYGMLYNSALRNGNKPKIFKGLLVSESKGGPDPKHPVALHESEVPVKTYLPEIRRRLKELRFHAEENSIPPPECTSTGSVQFLGCPFRKFCKAEVQEIQKQRRESARKDTEGLSLAVPTGRGNNHTRRNSRKRRSRSS